MEQNKGKAPAVSLGHLFRAYLNEDDSYEGAEVRAAAPAVAVAAVQEPAKQPVMEEVAVKEVQPVIVPVAVPTTVEVEDAPAVQRPDVMPAWLSKRETVARKSASQQLIHISYVDFFYDFVYAFVLWSFAVDIAYGWPIGKWCNFVQMLMLLTLWVDNVYYTTHVHAQDGLSRFLIFLSLIGVLGMAYHRRVAVVGTEEIIQGYVVSFLWARFWQIVLYAQLFFASSESKITWSNKLLSLGWAIFIAITCIPAAVSLGLTSRTIYFRVMIWLVGCGLDLLVGVLVLIPFVAKLHPLRADKQFRDRCGSFVLFLFGLLLVSIFFDEVDNHGAGEWATIALSFLIAFGFMWLYYDGDRHTDDKPTGVAPVERTEHLGFWGWAWFYAHLPLAMALVVFGDASAQVVAFYRGIPRLPNTVIPVATGPGQGHLWLSNTVQWIYGISFAIVLAMITITGLLYRYEHKRHLFSKFGRAAARFALVVIMVLLPLAGLNDNPSGGAINGLNPFIPVLVGSVLLFVLVVIDWALNLAFAPLVPDAPKRVITVQAAPSGEQIAQMQERIAAQDRDIAALRAQLVEANKKASAAPAVAAAGVARGAEDVDKVESELSSSKNWGFTSRTSSVVEDVVLSTEADESEGERSDSASVVEAGGAPAGSQSVRDSEETTASGRGRGGGGGAGGEEEGDSLTTDPSPSK